ncbi:hypothetical protein swp_1460 [Shewanella piezotolerans WP3]|uniref:Lipoprotein n=1 Tax=Shewanella piezotolerans (strain WP3 / JCM 13877) TaxID=225849 RepID=B8CKS0_SHEPW|nr:hypothetical protein [Shewanella piezotolerans]ACJ28246.1 hypothetical protein swp_1460 [Shewanella piezotolerans WP3]
MKTIIFFFLSIFIVACGSNVQRSQTGLEHEQKVVVIAESLIGSSITVAAINNHTIVANDLTPYATGIAGAADAADENRQILVIKLDKGSHRISIKSPSGTLIYNKEIYLADGQVRTIRL